MEKKDKYNLAGIISWIDKYRKALPAKINEKAPSVGNLVRILGEVSFEADDDYDTIPPQCPDRGWYSPLLEPDQKAAVYIYLFSLYNGSGKAKRKVILEGMDKILKSFNDTDTLIEIILESHNIPLADELVKRNVEFSSFSKSLAEKMLSKKIVVKEWVNLI